VYLHELTGFAVFSVAQEPLGVITAVDEVPTGVMLEVQGKKREFLLPFRKEFVVEVDRAGRRLVVDLPNGMAE
jgi:16S rRNA processing protein RimM